MGSRGRQPKPLRSTASYKGKRFAEGKLMDRNVHGQLMAACLLVGAVVTIGLALVGALQQMRAVPAPVAIVTR